MERFQFITFKYNEANMKNINYQTWLLIMEVSFEPDRKALTIFTVKGGAAEPSTVFMLT